jgi:hypothetical protein
MLLVLRRVRWRIQTDCCRQPVLNFDGIPKREQGWRWRRLPISTLARKPRLRPPAVTAIRLQPFAVRKVFDHWIEPIMKGYDNPVSLIFATIKGHVVLPSCTKVTTNAGGTSGILTGNAEYNRETRDNEAGEREGSGGHSAIRRTRRENKTAFRDCRHEEPGTSQPRAKWATSGTQEYAVRYAWRRFCTHDCETCYGK